VPVANTVGKEGKGMSVILSNFNHERWMITVMSASTQRRIVEECLKWSNQRVAFGKPLNSQAVIRHKLADMISRVEVGMSIRLAAIIADTEAVMLELARDNHSPDEQCQCPHPHISS
jgi:alkylation response protein AidB-like acyl-CoA dehydrogenase